MTKLLVESSPPSWRSPSVTSCIVDVPFIEHHDFIALMHGDTDYHEPSFEQWPFVLREPGQTYEALIWRPRCVMSSERAREFFRVRGYRGNVTVFMTWIMQHWPSGCYATIPEDEGLFRHYEDGLLVPCYSSVAGSRRFRLSLLGESWGSRWFYFGVRHLLYT